MEKDIVREGAWRGGGGTVEIWIGAQTSAYTVYGGGCTPTYHGLARSPPILELKIPKMIWNEIE